MKFSAITIAVPQAWPDLRKLLLVMNPGLTRINGSIKRQIIMTINLTTLLLIIALVQASAKGYSQVTLREKNAPYEKVLKSIEKQTGYFFVYNDQQIKLKNISVVLTNVSIEQALKACFDGAPITYQIIDKNIVLQPKEPSFFDKIKSVLQVPVKVSGKVTDTTGTLLPGATIINKTGGKAVLTDDKGEFMLTAQIGDELTISFIGFQPYTFVVKDNFGFQNVVLHASFNKLNEVVVSTGYQTIPKERATGSFVQIDNQLLNRRVSTDILSRLEGIVPGLLFNRNTINGTSGGVDISIRGTSTFFASQQPLIVVDGFPYDGDINNINPNSVESISILKDAAAASIWGVKSGNGVIVITSKKGKRNEKLSVEANMNVSIGQRPDLFYSPNFIKSADFIDLEKNLFASGYYDGDLADPSIPVSPVVELLNKVKSGQITQEAADQQIDKFKKVDVRNDLSKYFYRPSVAQQYSLNMKGGSDNNDYFLSLGYDNNLANIVGNKSDRLNISFANNFYPVKNLQLSAALNFTQNKATNNGQIDNIKTGGASGKLLYPYAQLVGNNGDALPISRDYNYSWVTDSATNKRLLDWQFRPYDELHNANNTSISNDTRLNFGLNYSFLKDFSIDIKYQYEKANSNSNNYHSQDTYFTRNLINSYTDLAGAVRNPIPLGGILDAGYSDLTVNRIRGQLNYKKEWKTDHEVNALVGSEINETVNEGSFNRTYGYNNETGNYQNADFVNYYSVLPGGYGAQIPNQQYFIKTTDRYISYFGNASYAFKERYIVSVSGRIDKSNLFGVSTNQKAVPLYSTGISWDFSKEAFYSSSLLPYGRIRITYGYNGNVDKSTSAYLTTIQNTGSYYNGLNYAIIQNPGNKQLRWEKVKVVNLGLDYALKNQVISGSIEYYVKNGIDLFGDSPLPTSTGLTTFRGNTASTIGNGVDVQLNSRNIYNQTFKWTTNFIYSYAKDKVDKYDNTATAGEYIINGYGNAGTITPLVGQPIFAIYSYKWAGLDPTNGDPQGFLDGKVSKDYTTIISSTTPENMVFSGSSRPLSFGSIRNTFSYNSFSLSVNIAYKFDYYFRRSSLSSSGLLQSWSGNSDYYSRWQKPGDEKITNVPSLQYPPLDNNRDAFYAYSSTLVEKGDHIRLQDINLSYHFDKKTFHRLPFNSLDIYCYMNNIGILWRANKYHLDPDSFSESYPLPRTIALGLKAGF